MSGRTRRLGIPIVIVAVAIGIVAVIATRLERVERPHVTPPSTAAQRDPFLAASRLLDRLGYDVEVEATLDRVPPTGTTLLWLAERRTTSDARVDAVVQWVESGGRLVVGPILDDGTPFDRTWGDPLLERLGASFVPESELDRAERSVYDVTIGSAPKRRVSLRNGFCPTAAGSDPECRPALELTVGRGRVVVLNDTRFLRSRALGAHDHALLLADLVEQLSLDGDGNGDGEAGGVVHVVRGRDRGPTFPWASRFRIALAAVACLLALLAVRHGQRFGPIVPEPPPGSRSVLEHLDASGRFLWRARAASELLAPLRRDAVARGEQPAPLPSNLHRRDVFVRLVAELRRTRSLE